MLALDTSTPFVAVGVVEVGIVGVGIVEVDGTAESGWHSLGTRAGASAASDSRHAETLGQLIPGVLAEADIGMSDLSEVVVGIGPGPFTGLRVGVMTAAAVADALGLPVYGVCTHDAMATMHQALAGSVPHGTTVPDEGFAVVTDARRRECYWADYDSSGKRISGPYVQRPADMLIQAEWRASGLVIGDPAFSEALETEVVAAKPVPMGLVLAARGPSTGQAPGPLEPLYLRRPDATPPAPRKPVTPR